MTNRDKIPPNKALILPGGILAAFSGWMVFFEIDWYSSYFMGIPALLILVVSLGTIWAGLGSTELDREGIHIHLPGFPDKIRRWEDIQQIGIIYRRRRTPKEYSQCDLVVIPKGCEPFVPQVDDSWSYMERNGLRVHREQVKYAPLFEKYWGPLDFDGRI